MAASVMGASPADLILDLGSGACWNAEWLQRLNLRPVSVDISLDMLRMGRSRLLPSGPARAVCGDLERLPFLTGSFDKAVCLNALHHIPRMNAALQEVSRILRPTGMAVFSEPGKGHSHKPLSVAAMRDYGVLEQDVLIPEFMQACHEAGFAEVRIKPLSYMISSFDLTLDEWRAWEGLARRKRPWRALQKIGLGVLEFFGLKKRGVLFEEAVTMNIVRLLKNAIEEHPVLIAYKDRALAESQVFAAEVAIMGAPRSTRGSSTVAFDVRVKNVGNQAWHASEGASNYVRVGVQLLDRDMKLVDRDYHREPLTGGLAPGNSCTIHVDCRAPDAAGRYGFKIDMVREAVAWFEATGSSPAIQMFDGR
jgi:SAM-dependent methyltransferase